MLVGQWWSQYRPAGGRPGLRTKRRPCLAVWSGPHAPGNSISSEIELFDWLKSRGAEGVENIKCLQLPSGERGLVAAREFKRKETVFTVPLESVICDWPDDGGGASPKDGATPGSVRLAAKLLRLLQQQEEGQEEEQDGQEEEGGGKWELKEKHRVEEGRVEGAEPASLRTPRGEAEGRGQRGTATQQPATTGQRLYEQQQQQHRQPKRRQQRPDPPQSPPRAGAAATPQTTGATPQIPGADSWGPYLRSLPHQPPALLLAFTEPADLAWLEYPPLEHAVLSYRELVAQHYERIGGAAALGGATLERFTWALAIVGSRCLGAPMLLLALLASEGAPDLDLGEEHDQERHLDGDGDRPRDLDHDQDVERRGIHGADCERRLGSEQPTDRVQLWDGGRQVGGHRDGPPSPWSASLDLGRNPAEACTPAAVIEAGPSNGGGGASGSLAMVTMMLWMAGTQPQPSASRRQQDHGSSSSSSSSRSGTDASGGGAPGGHIDTNSGCGGAGRAAAAACGKSSREGQEAGHAGALAAGGPACCEGARASSREGVLAPASSGPLAAVAVASAAAPAAASASSAAPAVAGGQLRMLVPLLDLMNHGGQTTAHRWRGGRCGGGGCGGGGGGGCEGGGGFAAITGADAGQQPVVMVSEANVRWELRPPPPSGPGRVKAGKGRPSPHRAAVAHVASSMGTPAVRPPVPPDSPAPTHTPGPAYPGTALAALGLGDSSGEDAGSLGVVQAEGGALPRLVSGVGAVSDGPSTPLPLPPSAAPRGVSGDTTPPPPPPSPPSPPPSASRGGVSEDASLTSPPSPSAVCSGWRVAVVVTADVAAGQELLLCYDPAGSNDTFALHYGFVPPFNPNDDVQLYGSLTEALTWHREEVAAEAEVEVGSRPPRRPLAPHLQRLAPVELDGWYGGALAAAASVAGEDFDPHAPVKLYPGGRLCPVLEAALHHLTPDQPPGRAAAATEEAVSRRCLQLLRCRSPLGADLALLLRHLNATAAAAAGPADGFPQFPARPEGLPGQGDMRVAGKGDMLSAGEAAMAGGEASLPDLRRASSGLEDRPSAVGGDSGGNGRVCGCGSLQEEAFDEAAVWRAVVRHYERALSAQPPHLRDLAGLSPPAAPQASARVEAGLGSGVAVTAGGVGDGGGSGTGKGDGGGVCVGVGCTGGGVASWVEGRCVSAAGSGLSSSGPGPGPCRLAASRVAGPDEVLTPQQQLALTYRLCKKMLLWDYILEHATA